MDFKVTVNGKDTLITRRQNSNFEEWNIYVPGKISNFQADPDNWLVCDLTSIRIRDEINAEEDIIIRPNPSNNIVNIQTGKNNGICNLLFIDASGRILLSKELDSGDFTLDVKEYPSGVYNIVFIDQNHNLFPYKFVKD